MYVTNEDIDTITELVEFVRGATESADDSDYWFGLLNRSVRLQENIVKQNKRQIHQKIMKKVNKKFNQQQLKE